MLALKLYISDLLPNTLLLKWSNVIMALYCVMVLTGNVGGSSHSHMFVLWWIQLIIQEFTLDNTTRRTQSFIWNTLWCRRLLLTMCYSPVSDQPSFSVSPWLPPTLWPFWHPAESRGKLGWMKVKKIQVFMNKNAVWLQRSL